MRAMALYNRADFRPTRLTCMASPFAKTTFGPPAPLGTDGDKGTLIADVASGICEMVDADGNTHCLETMLLALKAQTALTTITTAQNLFSKTLKANALNKAIRTLFITGTAVFSTAGTPQITLALTLGGVSICSIQTPAIANAQTNGQLNFQFVVMVATAGAAGTIEAHGQISVQGGASLAAAVPTYFDQNTAPSAAIDLTAAQALVATVASTVTLTTLTLRQTLIEVVG